MTDPLMNMLADLALPSVAAIGLLYAYQFASYAVWRIRGGK